ncbi:hypothetical protein NE237_005077 [Protea cynaroides]|uniref:Cyclin-dependent protein kinase inhibitor SMR3-like n=1 Tax=Protea cynaroides TaxID=273540 RepID=A0A9Q0KJX7_9MAGN|nr:hypothetical protein NE237_005077 [Protea cynaroides]
MEFDILFRSTLEFSDGSPIAADYDRQLPHPREPRQLIQQQNQEAEFVIKKMECAAAVTTRTTPLGSGEILEVEDEDEGFRTPTSLDHRIPVIKQCPPAPRKPKSSFLTKRKASSSSSSATRRQLFLLDLSQEIESLFPLALQADLGRKIKKIRGAHDDAN